jgi:hypothetical protein
VSPTTLYMNVCINPLTSYCQGSADSPPPWLAPAAGAACQRKRLISGICGIESAGAAANGELRSTHAARGVRAAKAGTIALYRVCGCVRPVALSSPFACDMCLAHCVICVQAGLVLPATVTLSSGEAACHAAWTPLWLTSKFGS